MNSYLRQFPDIYKSSNDSYVYFSDDGTRFHLIAGQDGVTEEWIAYLKSEHRKGYNEFRRSLCLRCDGEKRISMTVSLDAIGIRFAEEELGLIDSMPTAENQLILREDHCETVARFLEAWSTLTEAQQRLFIAVRIRKIPQKTIAEREGVSPTSIRDRLKVIDKKLRQKIFSREN